MILNKNYSEFKIDINKDDQSVLLLDNKEYNIQLIGSESYYSNTFLWGWNNKESNIPKSSLVEINKVKQYGITNNIIELINPIFELQYLNGHEASVVVLALSKGTCYYMTPYGSFFNGKDKTYLGSAFYLIKDYQLEENINNIKLESSWLSSIFDLLIKLQPRYNIRIAIIQYLNDEGIHYDINNDILTFDNYKLTFNGDKLLGYNKLVH
jgi:hypothetical protein